MRSNITQPHSQAMKEEGPRFQAMKEGMGREGGVSFPSHEGGGSYSQAIGEEESFVA